MRNAYFEILEVKPDEGSVEVKFVGPYEQDEPIIWNLELPHLDGKPLTKEQMIGHIADHFPFDLFEENEILRNMETPDYLFEMVGEKYEIERR